MATNILSMVTSYLRALFQNWREDPTMSPDVVGHGLAPSEQRHHQPELWITGLGAQYGPHLLGPEEFHKFAGRFYNVENPGIKKLLRINKHTGIENRSWISTYTDGFGSGAELPGLVEIDEFFRQAGVDLTVQACDKALGEWRGNRADITHTIGVTCTNQGSPGYDMFVARKLGLRSDVERTLLHGVGCAGGLAIMRAAAEIANSATARGKPARILAFACELCTPMARYELDVAEMSAPEDVGIASVLFSDAAAAFVLCNNLGLGDETEPLFELMEWGTATLPDTDEQMIAFTDVMGYRTIITRDVPIQTKKAVKPMFDKLVSEYAERPDGRVLTKDEFDWALHPGGSTIIDGVKKSLGLTEHQLRASREIYKTRGNSSSPTVLIVLDKLRTMGPGSDNVVATSFGPGLTIEMAMMRRCRKEGLDV